jgi:hypothetical protein
MSQKLLVDQHVARLETIYLYVCVWSAQARGILLNSLIFKTILQKKHCFETNKANSLSRNLSLQNFLKCFESGANAHIVLKKI